MFSAWLALALLLHAGLLLLPMPAPDPADTPAPALRLALPAPARIASRPEAAEPSPPSATLPAASDLRPVPPAPPPQATVGDRGPPEPAPAMVDSAELLDAVRRLERGREAPPRRLGVFRAPATPPNWRSAPFGSDNLLDGAVAPAKVRILDRWLAADGSHNVVLESPNGETLCGRAEAWDPMRPLVEHVMMFRTCGSGGDRSFAMPERYRRPR